MPCQVDSGIHTTLEAGRPAKLCAFFDLDTCTCSHVMSIARIFDRSCCNEPFSCGFVCAQFHARPNVGNMCMI